MKYLKRTLGNLFVLAALLSGSQSGAQAVVTEHMDDPVVLGSATYSIAFWDLYDLAFYVESADHAPGEEPYAMEFKYLRDYSDDSLVDRIISQIRVSGYGDEMRMAQWHSQLMNIYPDVTEGSKIFVILARNRETYFYADGEYAGFVGDPRFGRNFFGVWLGENSPESKVRDQLLNID